MEKIQTETAVALLPHVQQLRETYIPGITKYEFNTSIEYEVVRFEGFHKHPVYDTMMPFYRLKGGTVKDPKGIVMEISELMIPGEAIAPRTEKKIDFDSFRELIATLTDEIPVKDPRVGPFNLDILYRRKTYIFEKLKQSFSANEDSTGFSLNHYFQLYPLVSSNVRGEASVFHDSEDVSVDITRERFNWARVVGAYKIEISTKKWFAVLTWEGTSNGN